MIDLWIVVLLIIDMESAKSDVNGPMKKYNFGVFFIIKKGQKHN